MAFTQSDSDSTAQNGTWVKTVQDAKAFVPFDLPPKIEWTTAALNSITKAQTELGRLGGLGADFPNPRRLLNLFLRREAEYSSRIERTYAGVQTLVLFELTQIVDKRTPDAQEVENNYRLLQFACDRARVQPLSLAVLRQMHELLFSQVEHPPAIVGDFRKLQNWIGSNNRIVDARYVPPPPTKVVDCLESLVRFVVEPPSLPTLVRAAMVHYQFEAIHPFDDGNGRIGRALILWLLTADQSLDLPLLNPSYPLESRRREYYDLLLDVSNHGRWSDWIEYFCQCVAEECARSIKVIQQLTTLRNRYQTVIQQARRSALLTKLVDHLFGNPATTVSAAADLLGITAQSAQRALETLERLHVVTEVTGTRRYRIYLAKEIISHFQRPQPQTGFEDLSQISE